MPEGGLITAREWVRLAAFQRRREFRAVPDLLPEPW